MLSIYLTCRSFTNQILLNKLSLDCDQGPKTRTNPDVLPHNSSFVVFISGCFLPSFLSRLPMGSGRDTVCTVLWTSSQGEFTAAEHHAVSYKELLKNVQPAVLLQIGHSILLCNSCTSRLCKTYLKEQKNVQNHPE